MNCFRDLLPAQCTESVQPVDGGLGHLSASEKRILITKFVGAAWEKIFSREDIDPSVYFQKTGCLLTLDGTEDDLVRIEGLPGYKPPLLSAAEDNNQCAEESVPNADEEPDSDIETHSDNEVEVDELHQAANENFDMIVL